MGKFARSEVHHYGPLLLHASAGSFSDEGRELVGRGGQDHGDTRDAGAHEWSRPRRNAAGL